MPMHQFRKFGTVLVSGLAGGSVGLWIGINYTDFKNRPNNLFTVHAASSQVQT